GLGGSAQVRLGNNFDQRNSAAVEIDVAPAVGIRKTFVETLARVIFHVQAGDADGLFLAADFNFERAQGGQRQLVHRDLIALGQIGIEIVFARKSRAGLNFAPDRKRRSQSQLQRALVEDRK